MTIKSREKTGGRKKGTPNRLTHETRQKITERLDELDHDPLAALVSVAKDESVSLEIRVKIDQTLMEYRYAKRRSVETTSEKVTYEDKLDYIDLSDYQGNIEGINK